jgi:hypothetical protein
VQQARKEFREYKESRVQPVHREFKVCKEFKVRLGRQARLDLKAYKV